MFHPQLHFDAFCRPFRQVLSHIWCSKLTCFSFATIFIFSSEPVKPSIIASEVPQTVEAKDQSPVTLTIGDNVTALTNTSITIQCPTSGVPTPTVTWSKDGTEIHSGGRYKVQDGGSLLITDAEGEDNGRYTCSSGNVAGNASSSSMVQVVGKTDFSLC